MRAVRRKSYVQTCRDLLAHQAPVFTPCAHQAPAFTPQLKLPHTSSVVCYLIRSDVQERDFLYLSSCAAAQLTQA